MKHGVADRGVGAYAGRGKFAKPRWNRELRHASRVALVGSIRAQFRLDMAELSVVHSCFNADQCEGPPTEASRGPRRRPRSSG